MVDIGQDNETDDRCIPLCMAEHIFTPDWLRDIF